MTNRRKWQSSYNNGPYSLVLIQLLAFDFYRFGRERETSIPSPHHSSMLRPLTKNLRIPFPIMSLYPVLQPTMKFKISGQWLAPFWILDLGELSCPGKLILLTLLVVSQRNNKNHVINKQCSYKIINIKSKYSFTTTENKVETIKWSELEKMHHSSFT